MSPRHAFTLLAVLLACAGAARAQQVPSEAGAPAAKDAPATGAQAAPSVATTTSTPAAPPAAPAATPAAEEPPQAGAAVYSVDAGTQREAEQAKLREAERARLRVLLAKARAEQRAKHRAIPASQPAPQPEPRRSGDAGAAFAIGASLAFPFYDDPGLDLFDEDDVGTQLGLWLSYDVLELRQNAFLAVELGWHTESASSNDLFGNVLDTEITSHAVNVGGYARWIPLSFLQPHARIAAGLELLDVQVEVGDEARVYREDRLLSDATLPFASFGLGLTVRTPTRLFEDGGGRMASLSVGVMIEGGYSLRAPLELHLDGPGPSDGDIALSEGSLGELARSGPYIRTSIVLRY